MYDKFTDRARKVLQLANDEALRFNHDYVGSEHILLGLMKENSGIAAIVLKGLGVDLRKIRLEVDQRVHPGPGPSRTGRLPHTPRAQKILEYSLEESRDLHCNYVNTEHLLLGLLRENGGVGAQVLIHFGLHLQIVQEAVLQAVGFCEQRDPHVLDATRDFSIQIELCKLLFQFDQTISTLDTAVFEAAYHDGLEGADAQRDRAMREDFQPSIKGQRDAVMGMRNTVAQILGFSQRRAHDLSPRDYNATSTGYLIRV